MDLIDATGSGDVDTSTVVRTEDCEEREIQGHTGRVLKIPDEWKNPTGEWHVGSKALFELVPTVVRTRLEVCTCMYMYVYILYTSCMAQVGPWFQRGAGHASLCTYIYVVTYYIYIHVCNVCRGLIPTH